MWLNAENLEFKINTFRLGLNKSGKIVGHHVWELCLRQFCVKPHTWPVWGTVKTGSSSHNYVTDLISLLGKPWMLVFYPSKNSLGHQKQALWHWHILMTWPPPRRTICAATAQKRTWQTGEGPKMPQIWLNFMGIACKVMIYRCSQTMSGKAV